MKKTQYKGNGDSYTKLIGNPFDQTISLLLEFWLIKQEIQCTIVMLWPGESESKSSIFGSIPFFSYSFSAIHGWNRGILLSG